VPGLVLAIALFPVLAVTGIGTGPGPLGPDLDHGVLVTRDVGEEVTLGNVTLVNEGRLPLHLESIRLLPEPGATAGLAVTAVEVAPVPTTGSAGYIGISDGPGYATVPASARRPATGVVLPTSADGAESTQPPGQGKGVLQVLVRARVTQDGTWTYRGYEVTYRSGLVRHRAVLDMTVTACAPRSAFPDGCDPLE
jgi:hypothetical protein